METCERNTDCSSVSVLWALIYPPSRKEQILPFPLTSSSCLIRHVTISKEGVTIESDGYAYNIPCGERMKSGKDNNATRSQQAMGGDGKLPPSGVVPINTFSKSNETQIDNKTISGK